MQIIYNDQTKNSNPYPIVHHSRISDLFLDNNIIYRHGCQLEKLCRVAVFLPLPYLYIKNLKDGILSTGVFLILGTLNFFTILPYVETTSYGITIASAKLMIPPLQLTSLGILVFYVIVNYNSLINYFLDYQEWKQKKKS